ncbi:MAG: transketolase family protein [Actinobacteria bacterium]|nr:transketolase family protein [Actinomycetota bacterium]
MLDINSEKFKNLSGRDLYSRIFSEIGAQNKDIVMLGSDTVKSNGGGEFMERFPERTFNFGIAEQNMVAAGAGLAKLNKIPLVGMFGFLVLRTAEQIRDDVCYQNLNVKFFGAHPGLSLAAGGVTHHGINDISILRSFPNMTIIQPGSPKEAIAAISTAVLDYVGPVYLRIPDALYEGLYDDTYHFEIGKAYILQEGEDITIIASGATISIAKDVADQLTSEGISVRLINTPTIKPMDEDAIIKAAKETKGIITIEDNELAGGLGAEVCQIVCENYPTKVKMFGLPKDRFTVIGPSAKALFDYFGIHVEGIKKAAKEILS